MVLRLLHPLANLRAGSDALRLLRQYRGLALEMARRELHMQYAGQVLGLWWAVAHPLFLMALYIFIFAVVFRVRIGGTYDLPLDYTTYLLTGLVPWLSFQQAMSRSCTVLLANANLVKQVVFPLEVLPAITVIVNLLPLILGTTVLVGYVLLKHGMLPVTYLLLPVLIALQVAAMLGVAFLFSAVGLFFRDLKDVVQVFATAGVYLMPVFYLPEWVPPLFKPVLYLNPFSYMGWCYQDALYFGRFEHPWAWLLFSTGSLLCFAIGYRSFRKFKPVFGNAL